MLSVSRAGDVLIDSTSESEHERSMGRIAIAVMVWAALAAAGCGGSPEPEPAPTQPGNPVREYVAGRMVPASVALAAPEVLPREVAGTVILRLAPDTVTPEALASALRERIGRPATADSAAVSMAPRMQASLTCDRPCVVALMNPPAERAIDLAQGAEWVWSLTATRATGPEFGVTATLTTPVPIEGKDAHYSIGVYSKRLRVQVSYGQRLGDALGVASTHGTVLSLLGTAAAASMAWYGRRVLRRRRAGF